MRDKIYYLAIEFNKPKSRTNIMGEICLKRLLNLTIIFLIIFSSSVSVYAGDISFSVSGMDYVSGTPLADWGDSIRLYTGNRVSYNVDFPEAGMY